MAQIIKHRRGSLESLTNVTSSLSKGELVIASGSSNISPTNGSSIVFAAVENGQVQAVNRFMRGTTVPNTFSNAAYNGLVNGVPYYVSASNVTPTLYLLGTGANEAIDLIGNIQPFSTSVDARLDAVEASVGGGGNLANSITLINSFTASAGIRLTNLESKSASVDISITNLNASSASQQTSINAINIVTASLESFTASTVTRLTNLETKSASVDISVSNLNTYTASVSVSVFNINSFTASASGSIFHLNASSASQQTSINALNNSSASLNTFTASASTRLTNLETKSASVDISISNINSFTASTATSITNLNASSASQQVSINALNTYTGSNDTTNTAQNSRLTSLENRTGSYATTGSNTFNGTQIVSGSLYVTQDLIVIGSSSISNISASVLNIGDNQITLNTFTPAIRFGGISVIDSGSTGATGSLYWDSLNNHWLYEHPSGANEGYNSAILISGPKNTGTLGNEATLISGSIMLASGEDHVSGSIMSQADNNSKITIAGGLDVTGTISGSINGIGNVTAFSQSVDSRLDSVEASIGGGSVGTSISALNNSTASLNAFTASASSRLTNLETKSASVDINITNIHSFTASVSTSIFNINTYTASVSSSIFNLNASSASQQTSINALNVTSASLNTFTASASTRLTNLETKSASVDISISNLNSYSASVSNSIFHLNASSASQQTSINAINTVTASLQTSTTALNTFTASASTRLTNLETKSASVDISLASINSYTSSLKTAIDVNGANLIVLGDLTVQGSTVTLNTTELVVEDKLIVLASGSTTTAAANGAGIFISGANASFTYANTANAWTANIPFSSSAFTGSFNLPTGGSSKRIAFRETNGNLDLVTAPTVDGDILQWNGTAFTMSNVIDGGSF